MSKKKIFCLAFVLNLTISFNALFAQVQDVQLYTFAHSLIDHRPPSIPTPSDETTIAHWIYDIAIHGGFSFATTGQFGQINTHFDNLPPNSNLGYDFPAYSWDETQSSFADSDLNTIMLTGANFIQWVPPTDPDPSDPSNRTVVDMTTSIFDWVDNEKPDMRYYIYGNWPEMDLENAFPPTLPLQSEIDEFHDLTIGNTGSFANWWLQYQDEMMTARPELNTRLIPVGMIISKILTELIPNQIPFDELYEDSAPHGRASLYFMAGMISYMAMYERNIPADYQPSELVHQEIRNNLETIRNFVWVELNNFNFPNGESRVFYSKFSNLHTKLKNSEISLVPNPTSSIFKINYKNDQNLKFELRTFDGNLIRYNELASTDKSIDISYLDSGVYFIVLRNRKGKLVFIDRLLKI